MVETDYEGLPRDKIPWDPKIDHNKCTTCGKCIKICHMNVFKTKTHNNDKNKTTIVVNPNKCVVFCRGCESICPQNAISHPDEKETQKIIDKLHNNQKDGHD
jgi:NAD-dependent dihydropyrimidine dehydrogenase PreA subunit